MKEVIEMNPFSKRFEDINEQDIDELIKNKIQESIFLDYKKTVIEDNKFIKQISAFANTKGGVMIIGVETNNNDEPIKKTPVYKKDKEKAVNIIANEFDL